MPVFVSTDFEGPWPVGTAAVVHAPDEITARAQLDAELARAGLPQTKTYTLRRLARGETLILNDGNY